MLRFLCSENTHGQVLAALHRAQLFEELDMNHCCSRHGVPRYFKTETRGIIGFLDPWDDPQVQEAIHSTPTAEQWWQCVEDLGISEVVQSGYAAIFMLDGSVPMPDTSGQAVPPSAGPIVRRSLYGAVSRKAQQDQDSADCPARLPALVCTSISSAR